MNVTPRFVALSPDPEGSGSGPAAAVDARNRDGLKYVTRLWAGIRRGRAKRQQKGGKQAKQQPHPPCWVFHSESLIPR